MEEIDFVLVMSVNPGFVVKSLFCFRRKIKIIREKIDVFSRKVYSE